MYSDPAQSQTRAPRRAGALLVALGIFVSRIFGLVRVRVFSYYFGLESDAADAFNTAFRIPNLLQNLFGEGALSGSFIPVYSNLLAKGETEEAERVAGAVAGLLSLAISVLVLVGVLATPYLIAGIAPGFEGEKRELAIRLVRILFPGAGLLVISAWCLGVLNSHHRFFLSYAAPVMWNLAMIAALVIFGGRGSLASLAVILAWASVLGSLLQILVQVPTVLAVAGRLRPALGRGSAHVGTVVKNFWPVFMSRGVVQISAYVDQMIGSLLPTGAITGLANAQLLYTLPVSLFGMSVSAAELPAMSRVIGQDDEVAAALRARLESGLRQIAFFVVPSAMAFIALGDVVAATILQTGRFRYQDAVYVWAILAGSAIGLLPSTFSRLYSSTFWALRDTRTPLRFAIVRVTLTAALGYAAAVFVTPAVGLEVRWGAAALTAASAMAACVEFALLRRGIGKRIGAVHVPGGYLARLWGAAAVAAAAAWALKVMIAGRWPLLVGVIVLGGFGAIYLAVTLAAGVPQASSLLRRIRR